MLKYDTKAYECEKYGERFRKSDEARASAISSANALISLAESENRDLTREEEKEVAQYMKEAEKQDAIYERLEKMRAFDSEVSDRSHDPQKIVTQEELELGYKPTGLTAGQKPKIVKDSEGREFPVFSKNQSMSSWNRDRQYPEDTFGRYAISMLTGRRDICPEFQNAMSTTDNAGGGYIVPDPLSRQIIDRVRNASVLARSGAVFADMPAGSTQIATVESGATFSSVGENETIPESSVSFGLKEMHLQKRAVLIPMSVELLEDGYNSGQIITDTVVRDAAADLDNYIISGSTDPFFDGLVTNSSITETDGSVGAIAYEDLHNCVIELRAANESPGAYIIHPTIAGDLDILTTGDGSTSAKSWLSAPPSLEGIERLQTGNISTAYSLVGDFSMLMIGVKPNTFRIEVSNTAGDYFKNDQVVLKVVYRTSYVILRNSAFRRLAGITT